MSLIRCNSIYDAVIHVRRRKLIYDVIKPKFFQN